MVGNEANISHPTLEEPKAKRTNPLDRLFKNFHVEKVDFRSVWMLMWNIKVFRVSQDDPLQEVFRDASGVFYATTKLLHLQFVVQQVLTMEQST